MKNLEIEFSKKLNALRKKLDKIDSKIISNFSERMKIVKKIGLLKIKNNIEICQPTREKALIVSRKQMAKKFDLSDELIEGIFSKTLKESVKVQEKLRKK
jgi:chorismate mutase